MQNNNFYSDQSIQQNYQDFCQLCQEQNLSVMLNRALYDRYLTNINLYYLYPIQDFIQQQITPQTCKFKQQLCDNDQEQLMKRQYKNQEFQNKIQMLTQYYKFHRNVPRLFQKDLFKILGKYYDRLRHYDYKKIKCVLKEQQGISLTTEKSQQSSFHSSIEIKSKYSNVLGSLQQNTQNQSQILQDFCQKADKILQKVSYKKQFKGQYYSGEKKFQEYLLNLKKINNKQQKNTNPFIMSKPSQRKTNYNLYTYKRFDNIPISNLNLKSDRNDGFKKKVIKKKNPQIQLKTNILKQSLKNFKKSKNKNVKSIQKTTANQTISRQQKSRKIDKLQKTLQLQIQKNHNKIFKPLSTGLLALKSNTMMKTLDQIYKPTISVHQKYNSDKSKKSFVNIISSNNLIKLYQNKFSNRNSNTKSKNKITSIHNSKQIKNIHNKEQILIENYDKRQTQRQIDIQTIKNQKQLKPTRNSSTKRLTRSKSTSKTLTTNRKASENQLKTIDKILKSHQKNIFTQKKIIKGQSKENTLRIKQNEGNSKRKLKSPDKNQLKQRSKSRKSLHSAKPQRSSSSKKLLATQKIERSSSKSHINSARHSQKQFQRVKFSSIDPQSNKNNIDKFLENKLEIFGKQKKPLLAKFYN